MPTPAHPNFGQGTEMKRGARPGRRASEGLRDGCSLRPRARDPGAPMPGSRRDTHTTVQSTEPASAQRSLPGAQMPHNLEGSSRG